MNKIIHFIKTRKAFLIGLSVGIIASISLSFSNSDFELSKNLDIFASLYKEITINYVDETNPGSLMKTAIDAMLEELDPYTVFIPEAEVEDYRFLTTGEYGGIGSLIHKKDGNVIFSEPYEGFPAQKAGIMAGDIIIRVNDSEAKEKSTEEISDMLKGAAGSELTVEIKRFGVEKPLEFKLIREKIKINNVPYYGMVDNRMAYIRLTDFTQGAAKEVKEAYLELKKNNNVEGVIIDLRGNGGGLLDEAVKLSNIFVPKGELIVSTKGKTTQRNTLHKTNEAPVDIEIPLAVLVDRGSASASEIFAGAMQDLDRGVIIGQRTFGKGLVQNIVPLSYNSKMKITVAKYYIPSGRCIQAIDYSHRNEDGSVGKIPDSLINKFNTKNGRIVYDGGGIVPDLTTKMEKYSLIAQALVLKYMFFDFATKFRFENPKISEIEDFVITDEIYSDFKAFLKEKNFDFETQSEKQLAKLKKVTEEEQYYEQIKNDIDSLSLKFKHNKDEDLDTYRTEIAFLLKQHIIMRYYHHKGAIKASLVDDPDILKAKEVLLSAEEYARVFKTNTNKE